eukprot:CAMPEP_0204574404 /NCGR_PEP_ID=MMETSP0661-20131031/40584_1 /ASSEMBLY_ACC=CAM_ASM_000606 /TAXON_ID=109239 /ORGANISM="Alexandrium margalefi, Strain AMGDE01CS-322" /LENGTH=197 /DNA_ID=CAMNT_0051582931 /DNA_START=49 /DNA_END=642 /DNA_ORIENTATION=-
MVACRILFAASVVGAAWGLRTAKDAPFDVTFEVNTGGDAPKAANVTVRVHPEWAPRGAEHFRRLAKAGWYHGNGVFRILPAFVAQFGLPAEPHPELSAIPDDPVKVRNKRGTLSFASAGPNSRTSQLFFNYGDNSFLDEQGFAPFAEVLGDGMQVIDGFYSGYGQRPVQEKITALGNAYLDTRFPKLPKVRRVTIHE